MLVFGGFNGSYFQDLFHINVHEPKPKFEINNNVFDEKTLTKFINNEKYSDYCIQTN